MDEKKKWRRKLIRRTANVTPAAKKSRSRRICRSLRDLIRKCSPDRIFAFAPTHAEPDIRPLYRGFLKKAGQKLAFPQVIGSRLEFFSVQTLKDLRRGSFGILEPAKGRKAGRPRRGDVILVPCVGWSREGYRLGHGGGFYDRWLGKNPVGLRVAVLFHCQVVGRLPHGRRDVAVHCAVTERGCMCAGASRHP